MIGALNPWVLLGVAAFLAVSHGTSYVKGREHGGDSVSVEWNKAKEAQRANDDAERSKKEAKDAETRAILEQKDKEYVAEKKRNATAAANADAALSRLRERIAAVTSNDLSDRTSPSSGVDGLRAIGDVFGECATVVGRLAGEADRLETKIRGLQAYASTCHAARTTPQPIVESPK